MPPTATTSTPSPARSARLSLAANTDHDLAGTTIVFNMDPGDPNHFYYQDDGVAGQVSREHIGVTNAANDASLAAADPDHPQSWWSIKPTAPLPMLYRSIDGYSQDDSQHESPEQQHVAAPG